MSYQKFHDRDVIALQLRSGNAQAFQYILDQFCPALCFFATRLTDDEVAAAGIVEEVIVKLWEARRRFYSLAAIRNFLYASTRNGCFNHVKKGQPSLSDQVWLQIWQETESYVQHEVIRAEVLREVCNHIGQAPFLRPGNVQSSPDSHHFNRTLF